MSRKLANIYDVARHANVAIKTVSRVVNNESGVSQQTREKVEQAIAALGYRPNRNAQSLARAQSWFLALVFQEGRSELVTDVQAGMIAACRESNHHLVIEELDARSSDVASALGRLVATSRPDGLLLLPPVSDQVGIAQFQTSPPVRIARIASSPSDHDVMTFMLDDEAAAFAMVSDLIAKGHRRIACIRGDAASASDQLRVKGFLAAMENAGITVDPSLVEIGDGGNGSGMLAASVLLSRSDPPSAIFATSDDMAIGVLSTANRMGIAVPNRLSVCGFGNTSASRTIWPALTTVAQPVTAIAYAAARWLMGRPLPDPPELTPTVVRRETVAAPTLGG